MDVLECKNVFQKMHGLMFKKKSKPLLFLFNSNVNEAIHSFFCVPFIAIWFLDNQIIDIKYVKPWKPWIVPSKKFNKLLEIPVGNSEFKYFIDGLRKV